MTGVRNGFASFTTILPAEKLNWRTPLELRLGYTPDISSFRFAFWEPIWYYIPAKAPLQTLHKARWLGFAQSCGDALTYYIRTERSSDRDVILVRSLIKSRIKNRDSALAYINDDPALADFFLPTSPASGEITPTTEIEMQDQGETQEMQDLGETQVQASHDNEEEWVSGEYPEEPSNNPTTDPTNESEPNSAPSIEPKFHREQIIV
jgi:hypothetical protein